ncbi:LacI family transcriptional regulator [Shimwellia pseudoproteus]|uniref:LacI family DNA-binding transcriptional regulator n=1 Tax=Shimwellia pseudoproteus TaxID=570012 RepID=UPI0018ED00C9|nr:LacI family DNA-binding transcriptional regulator [Shimwellia pseudoproteus]MBJ3816495.1 LacI family transcriptional regulator [Shimwellia pseudoproteus]
MANIRDVARKAGVSITSVSNLLNNRSHQMSGETRLRIEQAMGELGYHPLRNMPAQDKTQSPIIGLLVPSIVNPSFSALAHEIDLAARAYRYRVLLGNSYRQEDEERAFIDDMFSQGVRGIIVAASDIRKTYFVRAAERGMMIVSYDNRFPDGIAAEARIVDSVSMDNIAAGRLAAEHLISRGCRRIIFATEATLTLSRSHKIEGFLAAMRHGNIALPYRVIEGQANRECGDAEMFELGQALVSQILAIDPRPDGIVAINDALGIGMMVGLRAAGVAIPGEISLVGIDNISLSGLASPALTSVMPPLAQMARLMVERVIRRMAQPGLPPGEYLFAPQLISRQSVRIAGH